MARRSSAKPSDLDSLAIARDSLHKIRKVSEESLFGLYEIDPEKAFRLSYLREQFRFNIDLDALFNRYTERINQAYFSLFLMLQAFFSISHFIIVLVINVETDTLTDVKLDLIFYSVTGVLSLLALYLNESYVKNHASILRITSFIIFSVVFLTDLTIPIYYYAFSISTTLRPAYTVHVLIACYLFCNISSHLVAFLLGMFVTICHLLTLGFVTYHNYDDYVWERLGSDLIFLLCINALGVYFRFANELVKRRAFLDHRACVESTLKLKYEKEQEEQLMLSIIPEHTINEVRKDILNKIEQVEKLFKLPTSDPMEIPYVHEYDNVTILYADIVNYTAMTSRLPVITLVETLNELFGGFDDASEELNVLRIKFLGDCYYSVAGLPPNPAPNHAEACVDLGLKMISIIRSVREKRNLLIDMRIGVHSGKILSGLIGSTKWQFDIWSNDVYLANKMETTGEPGKVHITKQTNDLIKKSYNITPTDKGSTDEKLIPYNVTTFLISPQEQEISSNTIIESGHTLPKTSIERKRLSMVGEVEVNEESESDSSNEDHPNHSYSKSETSPPTKRTTLNGVGMNGLVKSSSVPSFSDNDNNEDVPHSVNYGRRGSLRPPIEILINRRFSGNPGLIKQISLRRNTPRRTAFMDNNINRYNERLRKTDQNMKEAIENMPLTKYEQWIEVKEINPLLLTFRDCRMEWEYVKLLDPLFKYYLISYVLLLISAIVIQNLTLPQWDWAAWLNYGTLVLMIMVLIPLTWMHSIWNRYFARNRPDDDLDVEPNNAFVRCFYTLSLTITTNAALRTAIYLITCGLFLTCVLRELIECKQYHLPSKSYKSLISVLLKNEEQDLCVIPWHMNYTLSLAILAGFSFLRIHIWLKLLFASAITIFYSISVWNFSSEFYEKSETFNYMMKSQIAHIMSLVTLTITLHLIDRQTDYLNRLDYQWNQKLITEKMEVNTMHKITKMLLKNILPIHVAEIYLNVNRNKNENMLYNEEYDNVAVIFATVVDYPTDCSQKFVLEFMNRTIKDFDNLLPRERRKPIEKIKVTNWTYMAACGLDPGRRDSIINGFQERSGEHVTVTLVKFAVDMIKALKRVNLEAAQECKLRIGIDNGPVMAGVVGSKKPFYDIWGDTVNVASRMDSLGIPEKIQVTKRSADVLQKYGIACEYRGLMYAKGKGDVPTYFVSLTENDDLIYNTAL